MALGRGSLHQADGGGPAKLAALLIALLRGTAIVGREDSFRAFRDSVSLEDIIATAEGVLSAAHVPDELRHEALSRLAKSQLTTSRQQLIFNYKVAFESMR